MPTAPIYMGDPGHGENAGRRADLEEICGVPARRHRPTRRRRRPTSVAGAPADFEGRNTTHFSVIDRDGNAVSNTYTLNFSYGLGLVADGTGVLLNNELDDFTAKPGAANAYGLVGFNSNLPGPGKRPLSSMTPTIVLKDGKPFLVTGSPGGSRIITTVLQVITNVIDFHMSIADAVTAPRLHDQWQPDQVMVEPGFAPAVLDALARRRPQNRRGGAGNVGEFHRGHQGRLCRRRRHPHPRRAGGGLLSHERLSMSDSVERVREALGAAGHADTITMFPEGTRTAQDAANAVGCTVAQIVKSIVLRAGEQVVLVLTSGANRVDTAKISTAVGQPVKSADGRWVRDVTGFAIGGVAPVGHLSPPRVFIDADLMRLDLGLGGRRLAAACLPHRRGGPCAHDRRRDYRCEGRIIGAGEGIRTLDPDLGKVVLYP